MKRVNRIINLLLGIIVSMNAAAQTYELKYSNTTDPFKWTINKIEGKSNNTYVYLTVKNEAYGNRALNFSTGEYAYTDKYKKGIKSTYNSISKGSSNNLNLKHGEEVSIILEFPGIYIYWMPKLLI